MFFYYYLIGLLFVSNLIVVLKFTNISVHIYNIFNSKNKFYLHDELEDYFSLNYPIFGELFACPICLSTHLSWITSIFLCFIFDVNFLLVPLSMFTWPCLVFLFYSILFKLNN